MKVKKWHIALGAFLLVLAFLSGQFTGYLNRRVAEGTPANEISQHALTFAKEWVDDTDGRWVW